ncbi:MAG: hypothetical protein OEZ15_10340, partial [Gammaproteobacteria bacterium]|nr:hypothetical protein [Gammaproteobacteria bacterium]
IANQTWANPTRTNPTSNRLPVISEMPRPAPRYVLNHDVPGCGIGLSIVMRVIELHNAKFEMSLLETETGLIVTVTFPNNEKT